MSVPICLCACVRTQSEARKEDRAAISTEESAAIRLPRLRPKYTRSPCAFWRPSNQCAPSMVFNVCATSSPPPRVDVKFFCRVSASVLDNSPYNFPIVSPSYPESGVLQIQFRFQRYSHGIPWYFQYTNIFALLNPRVCGLYHNVIITSYLMISP